MFAQKLLSALLLTVVLGSAAAQTSPQQAAERALQARDAAQREFTMRLDSPPGPPPALSAEQVLRMVTPPAPSLGGEPVEHVSAPELPPAPAVIPSAPPVVNGATLLEDSQRRRAAALAAENARLPLDDPARVRSTQIQGLTFERETRAQDLGSAIMRDSARAVGH
jgi:hypothetical protein